MSLNISVDAMSGLYIISRACGDSGSHRDVAEAMVSIITGQVDYQLRCASLFQSTGKIQVEEHELTSPEIDMLVGRIKDHMKSILNGIFDGAAREEQRVRQQALESLQLRLRDSNRPSEHGTVAEIAARLGISKSEVRRRKADGTLDQLINSQP